MKYAKIAQKINFPKNDGNR